MTFSEKLQALTNPDDEDSEELREWMGDDFDAERFELDAVNRELQEVFRPAPRKRKRSARSK